MAWLAVEGLSWAVAALGDIDADTRADFELSFSAELV
jgi:hypothetical protein